jgi:hypothetical protein
VAQSAASGFEGSKGTINEVTDSSEEGEDEEYRPVYHNDEYDSNSPKRGRK